MSCPGGLLSRQLCYGKFFRSNASVSLFTLHCLCIIATNDAHIILRGHELRIRRSDGTITMHITDTDVYHEPLQHYFGIDLPHGHTLPVSLFSVSSVTIDLKEAPVSARQHLQQPPGQYEPGASPSL
ncbi:arylamine N-acetyltransferase [Ktedonobacter sp. SOSP1-85]|uniref:arylamine N-acetyltransferase n=1 Tax=Ktedonobacter sp. SOSP1-85 TaxID=2778367 RepID=UPI0035B00F14